MRDLVAADRSGANTTSYLLHLENALACAVGIDSVVENCLHYVDEHCTGILMSERFTKVQPDTLRAVLDRDTLFTDEDIICTAVNRWAVAACKRSNLEPSSANRREVLGELLYLVRFPLLTITPVPDKPAKAKSGFSEALSLLDISHDKGRFPTQPRRSPVIRVGEVEFEHGRKYLCLIRTISFLH
ncbi:BTB/POZ domain-containing protein 2-like [Paramacrobiotus metropolitanus]|uniref:BTB/POZ domain-containing protein 2-like n=1 Tax=Paramacrobiotus metropolitanus TaxID=2943436 RepID=UPI002445AB76|nr:BTB/POZ domain-containing protein 2-like [Paramacrobiotus metropolitanus]